VVNSLLNLVVKEIKELLKDPKILLGVVLMPLIIFPLMGSAMNVSTTAVEQSTKRMSIALMDLDHGHKAEDLVLSIKTYNISVQAIEGMSVDDALTQVQGGDFTALVIIPQGFNMNLSSGRKARLDTYTVLRSISVSEGVVPSVAIAPIQSYERGLIDQAVKQAFPDRDPDTVLNPLDIASYVSFRGRTVEASPALLQGILMSQSFGFPMVIMLLLISSMQTVATSISVKKEEKTLETLLTLPVGRLSILTRKLAGSVIVAAVGAATSLIGVSFYTSSIVGAAGMSGVDLMSLGLAPTPMALVLLGVMMFVTIVSALALAICVATFADNVRSAQSLVGPLSVLVILPSLMLMFADISILPPMFQAVMYAVPYMHSILASKAAFMGDYTTMLVSIAYISLFIVAILYVTARIFTTERIITARFSFRRRSS